MNDSDKQSMVIAPAVTSVTMVTLSNGTAGITGLCLTGSLLLLAIWRVRHHFSSNEFSWTSRRVFHVLFCVAMLVESLSYADLCRLLPLSDDPNLSERLGYVLLEVVGRSLLEVITYWVVTALWLDTIGKRVDTPAQKLFLGVCGTIILATSTIQAVEMIRSDQEILWIYQLHCFVEASCWLLHFAAAVACCGLTTKRIISLSTLPQFGPRARIKILVKALLPMLLCSTCYAIRSGWLYSYELQSRTPTYSRESLFWWIGFTWIPTLVPSLMLLYSTRKRDIAADYHGSDNTPLLLSPPGPPAEAFVSFQRLNPDSLWSPVSIRSLVVDLTHQVFGECEEQSSLVMHDTRSTSQDDGGQEETILQ